MRPLPFMQNDLERGYSGAIVHFVRFATVALAAELRRLVAAGRAACRVVRGANEEHGRVGAARQTGLVVHAVVTLDHVHQVLVVAWCKSPRAVLL